jgi:hypothetical protein
LVVALRILVLAPASADAEAEAMPPTAAAAAKPAATFWRRARLVPPFSGVFIVHPPSSRAPRAKHALMRIEVTPVAINRQRGCKEFIFRLGGI